MVLYCFESVCSHFSFVMLNNKYFYMVSEVGSMRLIET